MTTTDDFRPTMDAVLLEVAYTMSLRGTCSRHRVGAVVALDGRICATGYNGAPRGLDHCDHRFDPANEGCRDATHAEANAVAFAARTGVALEGATLYTTLSPCLACAMLIVNAGIARVVYAVGYRDVGGVELLERADVRVTSVDRMPKEPLIVSRWGTGSPS